jgi:ABC-type phosphate/phosphonate transport system substrate-binding protein
MTFLEFLFSMQTDSLHRLNSFFVKVLCLLITFQLSGMDYSIAQEKDQMKRDFVRMGALASMVNGIELKDADAAFKIWTDTFVKRLKAKDVYDFTFEYKMYDDVNTLKKDLKNNFINYFNVSTEAYFDLNADNEFVPFLSGTNNPKDKFMYYLLITSAKNKNSELKFISNKKILISKSNENTFGKIWLKTYLREELGEILFRTINFSSSNQNENEDLLAVFFGKADYAIISNGAYELACELNPSIKNKIRIIKKSGSLVNGVFVYRKGMKPSTIKAIRDIATAIDYDNEGKQILNLFKISKIVSITSDDLLDCEKVIYKYHKYFK